MKTLANVLIVVLLAACAQQPNPRSQLPLPAANRVPAKVLSAAEILAQSNPAEWRAIAAENTLVMETARGTVVLELASAFAPAHVENLKVMARAGYFDGLAITRSQDNFVVQWGDPNAEDASKRKSLGTAKATLPAEFTAAISSISDFTLLPDADGYAPEVGFSQGFAVGRDKKAGLIWPAHCYGAVGAGRDVGEETGSGAELYVVTGHAPRQLDRNISIVARVISGIDVLSVTQRGPAPMGFYEQAEMRTAITSIRVGSDLPAAEQPRFEALRTDSASFAMLVEARRNRLDTWYKRPAGYIDLCNVPLPVRVSRTIVNTH
jgi:peptidylprolyl isomerase